MRASELAKLLAGQAVELCSELLPGGKVSGREYEVGSLDGEKGKSLKVCISGAKAGMWMDFAGDDSQKGDLIGLIMQVKGFKLKEACDYAANFLHVDNSYAQKNIESRKPNRIFERPKPAGEVLSGDPLYYLTQERSLSHDVLAAFKVYSKRDNMCFPYFVNGEVYFIKSISVNRDERGKKIISTSKNSEPCLFGWQALTGNEREIIICEGEIDCISWYQYGFAALSVPFGAGKGSQGWIEYEFDRLSCFDTIYVSMDMDKAGQEGASEIVKRLGEERCRIISLPFKDCNVMLQDGYPTEEVKKLVANAAYCDPLELKWAGQYSDNIYKRYYPGVDDFLGVYAPWSHTYDKIMFRPAELSVWRGFSGSGKSQLLGQILLATIEQKKKVCVASMELKPDNFLYKLTRQASAGKLEPSREYFNRIMAWLNDNLCVFDCLGTAKAEKLLTVFEYAHKRYGIEYFLIDSFMKLDIAEDDYKAQKAFIEKLCDFKNKYNLHIHLITHSRKRASEIEAPNKMDVKGSGSIVDMSDNCFVIWRNRIKEEVKSRKESGEAISIQEEKHLAMHDMYLGCDKNRNGDWEGKLGFYFHVTSFQFTQNIYDAPIKYVE